MSDRQITNTLLVNKVPTKILVNTDTGQAEAFVPGIFGDRKIAEVGANNEWKITDRNLINEGYNRINGTSLSSEQTATIFLNQGVSTLNNERASIINANSAPNTRRYLSTKPNPVPGIINPDTGLKPGETTQTEATTDPNAQNPTPASGTDQGSTAQPSTQPEPDATPAPDATIASLPATSGNNSPVKSGEPAYYPLDIVNNKNQDRIKFTAVEIQDKGGIGGELKYKPVTNSGPVYLSIQSPISDQNSVDWGPGTMGPIEKAMFNSAYNGLQSNTALEAVMTALGDLANKANEELRGVGAVGNAAIAAMAAGNINLFTRATSLALNPNLELLFNAPQLRPFAFSFLLTAREEREVKTIKKIIKYFKYHMAVRNVESKLFLKTPHVFFIDYQYGNGETHKSINLIAPEKLKTKACALTNFSVDYTPLGTYMTYTDSDKTMVAYRLNMQFMEITPVYQGDYDEGIVSGHPIGY